MMLIKPGAFLNHTVNPVPENRYGIGMMDSLDIVLRYTETNWHDGQFGYSAEVYRNEGSTSEYTVKLKYDNGKEEERIVDAEKVNASSCNMVDLSVRLYHLEAEGKIENPAPEIILAHIYLQHRMPNANENTIVDYRSWYEQQLDLELQNDRNEKNISRWMNLLDYL